MPSVRRFWIHSLALAALLVPAAALATGPAPQHATDDPLFWYFTTVPDPPNDDQPTLLTVHGGFPWPRGRIVGRQILGPVHVEVTMEEVAGSADTSQASRWDETFDLGVLPAGTHNLRVSVRDAATPDVAQEFFTWLTVVGDPGPPPPPPPPPPTGPLFAGAWTSPDPATTGQPTVLVVHGSFHYPSGFVSQASVLSPSHVSITLNTGWWVVPDSAYVWYQPLDLGILPAGRHDVQIDIRDAGTADSLTVHEFSTSFDVVEAGPPPPPPPPPKDSLLASRPNPFSFETRFGVHVESPSRVEVGIFDLQGRSVRTLFRGVMDPGEREFVWDGKNDDGAGARAGVYFYRMVGPGRTLSRRVVLLRQP